jgi:hypothetical protein
LLTIEKLREIEGTFTREDREIAAIETSTVFLICESIRD